MEISFYLNTKTMYKKPLKLFKQTKQKTIITKTTTSYFCLFLIGFSQINAQGNSFYLKIKQKHFELLN